MTWANLKEKYGEKAVSDLHEHQNCIHCDEDVTVVVCGEVYTYSCTCGFIWEGHIETPKQGN
jgi:hypothetical protein